MNKKFYVLVDKRDLRFHVVDGNTTDDIMDALSSQKLETIKNYLKKMHRSILIFMKSI